MRRSIPHAVLALAALLVAGTAVPVEAQQNSYVGRWRCEQANYTTRNLAADNFTISWIMDLNADGSYYAEGTFFGQVIGYPDPLQAQGRWSVTNEGIQMQGAAVVAGYELPFNYALKVSGAALLKNEHTVAGQSSTMCERVRG